LDVSLTLLLPKPLLPPGRSGITGSPFSRPRRCNPVTLSRAISNAAATAAVAAVAAAAAAFRWFRKCGSAALSASGLAAVSGN